MKWSELKIPKLCPTLWNPIDYSPWNYLDQNTGVGCLCLLQGIFPRILEWIAIPFSRGYSQPRDWNQVSCITGGFFTFWVTREAPNYRQLSPISTQSQPHIISFSFNSLCFCFFFHDLFMLDVCFLLTLIILGLSSLVLFTTTSK